MKKRNAKIRLRAGSWWRRIFLNRKYRDVLFRRLFRDKRDLLDLYNALNGSAYGDPGELEVATLEDVIFMKMKNDLSFIIGGSINLYEHQSTWNPNMPLRGLFYYARQFEGLVSAGGGDLYGGSRIGLPTPVYIVFYNGGGMETDSLILYLSDSFSGGRGSGCLECSCKVLNISRGYNAALMRKCRRLREYSEFISEIDGNLKKGMSREEAVEAAIDGCIEKDILRDILVREREEVLHMLLTHYDEKKHLRNTFREGREEGLAEGLVKGREEGKAEGLVKGREEGKAEGREDKLRELIQKKLAKGMPLRQIAEELEEDVSAIEKFLPPR